MRTICLRPPCFSSSLPPRSSPRHCNSFLCSFRPGKRSRFLKPCSSLRPTKQQQQQKQRTPSGATPQSLQWLLNLKGDDEKKLKGDGDGDGEGGIEGKTAVKGDNLAGVLLVGVVGGFTTVGYVYKDQINAFLNQFSTFIEGFGPAAYALFVAVYAGLEILAIPAIPLTMSAGLLFGSVIGTIIVSISGTVAASVSFLIARYFARNCLYGLTSVKFVPYVLGSWLGMLPGTWAYVSAGAFGRAIIQEESDVGLGGGNGLVTLGLGLLATALAAAYVTRLAKDAVKDIE